MIYIYPFDSYFRFTSSVAILSSLLLYFRHLPVLRITTICGLVIFLFRSASLYCFGGEELWSVILHNFPSFLYYLTFGLLFTLLKIRDYLENVPALLLLLSITDIASNCVELISRQELYGRNAESILASVIGIAILRAIIAVYGYYAFRNYRSFLLAEDQAIRYAALTLMIAKLKSELFFLQKSSQDIELVMQKGHTLYKKLSAKDPASLTDPASPAAQALAIARDIHEVKKDYYRVTQGIESILEHSPGEPGMSLSEIFQLMEQNTKRFVLALQKKIHITFINHYDLITDKHFTLVSILDNLIMNAIDAVGSDGVIIITGDRRGERLILTVSDNGQGIKASDLELIFAPGYSTKFSEQTGQLSTGLGLSHVTNLTEHLGGSIKVASEPGKTLFTVQLPLAALAQANDLENI
ncbi:MAG: ATP-binding protein [Sporomusaceae bacterium]|nr:ATP-binding protein [Sporomusaceae bacterium]